MIPDPVTWQQVAYLYAFLGLFLLVFYKLTRD